MFAHLNVKEDEQMKRSVKRAKAIVSLTVAVGMCAITVNSAVIVTPAQEISINQ